jgi:hypothetical protein
MDLSPDDRTRALTVIAMAYIHATPTRWNDARRIIATIDSGGASLNVLRAKVHAALQQQWARQFNTEEMLKEGEIVMSLASSASVAQRLAMAADLIFVFGYTAEALEYEKGVRATQSLIDRTRAILAPVDSGKYLNLFNELVANYYEKRLYQLVGNPLPAITPKWTINGGSKPQPPRAGRVTLVVPLDISRDKIAAYAILRRLADKYGPQGLDVVLVKQNLGYSRGSLVQTPEEELKSMETLYIKFQKIPATILVEETHFVHLPDGRRIPQRTPFFAANPLESAWLVDRNGVVRWVSRRGVALDEEAQIEAYVKACVLSACHH